MSTPGRDRVRLAAGGLHVSFGGVPCLRDAAIELRSGTVSVLLGRSGSGKSTFLDVLAGVRAPSRGTVSLDGVPLRFEPGAAFPRIGYLMERPERQLFAPSVAQELAFGLERSGGTAGAEVIDRALRRVGLGGFADRAPWTLSRGEQRRVALASVAIFRPAVLLLDEPAAGLDGAARVEVGRSIREAAAAGAAVLVTGHDLLWAAAQGDRLLLLRDGRPEWMDLGRAEDRRKAALEGFHAPALWRFFERRLPAFWSGARWRSGPEALARIWLERLPPGPC